MIPSSVLAVDIINPGREVNSPIRNGEDVFLIIIPFKWIIGIVDDHTTAKPIRILALVMRVP